MFKSSSWNHLTHLLPFLLYPEERVEQDCILIWGSHWELEFEGQTELSLNPSLAACEPRDHGPVTHHLSLVSSSVERALPMGCWRWSGMQRAPAARSGSSNSSVIAHACQLSGSCGWSSLSSGLLGGHSFLLGNTHLVSWGFGLALGIILKNAKDIPSMLHIRSCQLGQKRLVWFPGIPIMTFTQRGEYGLWVERHPGHRRWGACHLSLRPAPTWHALSGNLNQAPMEDPNPEKVRRIRLFGEFFIPYPLAGHFNYK